MRILVVIPAFNEARSIGRVVGDIPAGLVDEVVVVNNASTDETERNARAAGATVPAASTIAESISTNAPESGRFDQRGSAVTWV